MGGGKWAFFTYSGCTIELEETGTARKILHPTKKTRVVKAPAARILVTTREEETRIQTTTEKRVGDEEDKDKEEEQAIEIAYVSEETPMVSYLNVHGILEAKRKKARDCFRPL